MDEMRMQVELTADSPQNRGYFSSTVWLPTAKAWLEDAMQRARWGMDPDAYQGLDILRCGWVPGMENLRLDAPRLDELNYLAKRLHDLPEEELVVYRALLQKNYPDEEGIDPVPVQDLINMTFGLDQVMVASNIHNDAELGAFVMENDLHPDVAAIPDESLYLLDAAKIGALQREQDGGVYLNGMYVVTGDYVMSPVYQTVERPADEPEETTVFRLLIAGSEGEAEWLDLPTTREMADDIAQQLGESRVEGCTLCDFASGIPQITREYVEDMTLFDTLNRMAETYQQMSEADQIKYKAVLERYGVGHPYSAMNFVERISEFELYRAAPDESAFFKDYLSHHLDPAFDRSWLDMMLDGTEGMQLLDRLGARMTEYGIVSAPHAPLFRLVPMESSERLEVVEILGQSALFGNGRVQQDELSAGMYKYDIRAGDAHPFATLEPCVFANYAGTVVVQHPIDFAGENFITLDGDTSPHFLGYSMTLEEFAATEFETVEMEQPEQAEDTPVLGGMQL